ncbi:DUF4250 domain-containing protein [Ruminococcus sp. HUN007]|uniref:DUF4250 domain-containing protein n=1 Tax=Ruminococcus sp. HUN007 TaxID=1514668 RepID=UPI000ADC45A8
MLPNDPAILLSVINTKLRDQYSSLAALCDDLDVSEDEIKKQACRYRIRIRCRTEQIQITPDVKSQKEKMR